MRERESRPVRPQIIRMQSPTVSIIIPSWNGAHLLPTCLDALRQQTYKDFEIIVVDNASSDGSRALLAGSYPDVRVIPLSQNLFYAGGVNRGAQTTSSPIVVALNNDTEAEPTWLEHLVGCLDRHPEAGMAASKLLLFDRRTVLHSAGDYYGVDGIPGNRGVWEEDTFQYDNATDVFSACGGAAAYRRTMLEDIGLFDEDLVGYCEDIDLAFRAQLAGYKCVYAPRARVYHMLSATGGGVIASYYCGRNFISVLVKNMPSSLLRKYWWRIALAQVKHLVSALLHVREASARARLRGQWDGVRLIPTMWAKRRQVFAHRKVSDAYLESILQP